MSAGPIASEFDSECFFITPIGSAQSPERKRADGTLGAIVEPSAEAVGLSTIRADKIDDGGHITLQILEHCVNARAAVADLTGGNLNVYYEVGIRHALRQPLILIADESMRDQLPFDLLQQRTIFYTDTLEGAASARDAVTEQLRRALDGNVDSPVQVAANLRSLQQGDAVQQTLAQLVSQIAELPTAFARTSVRAGLSLDTRRQLHEELELLETLAEDGVGEAQIRAVAERVRELVGVGRGGAIPEDRYFSSRIRELRLAEDMTQEELALASDLTVSSLSRIERGLSNPSMLTAERIARALGLSLPGLLDS